MITFITYRGTCNPSTECQTWKISKSSQFFLHEKMTYWLLIIQSVTCVWMIGITLSLSCLHLPAPAGMEASREQRWRSHSNRSSRSSTAAWWWETTAAATVTENRSQYDGHAPALFLVNIYTRNKHLSYIIFSLAGSEMEYCHVDWNTLWKLRYS